MPVGPQTDAPDSAGQPLAPDANPPIALRTFLTRHRLYIVIIPVMLGPDNVTPDLIVGGLPAPRHSPAAIMPFFMAG